VDIDRARYESRWANLHGEYTPEQRAERRRNRRATVYLPLASCAIDLANLGPLSLEQIGEQLGLTRERVRQIETLALRKVFGRSLSINKDRDTEAARELRKASEP
jgi:hypothetical protein